MFNTANDTKMKMNFGSMSRPILRLLQVTGVFPISIRHNGYTFSWLSYETVYALIFAFGVSFAAIFFAIPLIAQTFTGYKMAMLGVMGLFMSSLNILLPTLGIMSTKSLAVYLEGWSTVEKEFLSLIGKSLNFSHLKLVNGALMWCAVLQPPIIIFCKFVYLQEHPVMQTLVNVWADALVNSLAAMWHIQAGLIAATFQELGNNFTAIMWSCRRSDPTTIRRYRLLYSRIASLTNRFEESMNLVSTIVWISLIIKMVFIAHTVKNNQSLKQSATLISVDIILSSTLLFFYCLTVLLIICKAGEKIATAGGSQFAEKMCALTPQLSSASRSEFKLFMDTVYLQAQKPKLAGCVKLDLGLVTTTFNITLAYLVVYFQIIQILE